MKASGAAFVAALICVGLGHVSLDTHSRGSSLLLSQAHVSGMFMATCCCEQTIACNDTDTARSMISMRTSLDRLKHTIRLRLLASVTQKGTTKLPCHLHSRREHKRPTTVDCRLSRSYRNRMRPSSPLANVPKSLWKRKNSWKRKTRATTTG